MSGNEEKRMSNGTHDNANGDDYIKTSGLERVTAVSRNVHLQMLIW